MKALWKGTISFALVSIPVKLYSATHKKDIAFHMLHKKCSTPLNYERHCSTCNATIPWEDVTHGYEYEKGKFVIINDEELERIPVRASKSIEILRFVDIREIEPIYFDKSYYLEPAEGGERAYALLREVIKDSGKVALAKITFKDKEHVAAIRIFKDVLLLCTLFYADELIKSETLNIPRRIDLDPKELDLAKELVRHFLGRLEIEAYHDEFREAVMELIKTKVAGKEIKVAPEKEVSKVVSLMEALKKSLEKRPKRKAV